MDLPCAALAPYQKLAAVEQRNRLQAVHLEPRNRFGVPGRMNQNRHIIGEERLGPRIKAWLKLAAAALRRKCSPRLSLSRSNSERLGYNTAIVLVDM